MRVVSTASKLALLTGLQILCIPAPAAAQSEWVKRAKEAARGTAVGGAVTRLSTEAQMLDATRVDLEGRGFASVPVGTLVFGIAGVDIKNDEGVRLRAYLHNPSAQEASVPIPGAELFTLVDVRGRKLELVSGPDVQGVAEGAATITIPALERVSIALLFAGPRADGAKATLKVGTLGMIAGIPVHTSAAASAQAPSSGSVWTQPPPPPPGPPADTSKAAPPPPPPPVQ